MTRLEEVLIKENRLRGLMEAKNLDGVLLKKQPNFSWLTAGGYNMVGIATEMGMTSLLITRTGRYLIANRIEAPRMMQEEGLAELGFELLEHEWYADREAELIQKVVGSPGRVGADVVFVGCQTVDGDIKRLRFSLTESEIERYLFLGERLSEGLEKVMLGIRPGDSECEIAGRVGAELWTYRIDPTGFQVAADERICDYRHPIPTTRMIRRYVMVCVNARYKGLITTITRLLHFGKPDPKLLKQFEDNNEIECRMIEATKPGMPASVPFEAGLKAYRELGYEKEWQLHHQGGAMGYYGRDSKVTQETRDLVEENQAFCWNPSITGTKTEDGFIAAKNGPIMITKPVIYPKLEYQKEGVSIVKPGLLVLD
ncbi:MAG: M24 family metallopeptidase [Deltaproteobacteria bacterium]|nr:MAG: M24 family metallopeptidase [Deltaproteobacteria bacterium]